MQESCEIMHVNYLENTKVLKMVSSPSSSLPPSTITIISFTGIVFIIIILFITTIISPSSSSPWALLSTKCYLSCDVQSRHKESFWPSFFANSHPFSPVSVKAERSSAMNSCIPSFLYSANVYWKSSTCQRAGQATETQLWIKMNDPCYEAHRLKGEPTSKQLNPQINTLITGCCVI